MRISLPPLEEQEKLITPYLALREEYESLLKQIEIVKQKMQKVLK